MNKWLAGILGAVGMFFVVAGLLIKRKAAMAISIIGGADGPTSVFVAGKVGKGFPPALIGLGVLVLLAIGLGILRVRRKGSAGHGTERQD